MSQPVLKDVSRDGASPFDPREKIAGRMRMRVYFEPVRLARMSHRKRFPPLSRSKIAAAFAVTASLPIFWRHVRAHRIFPTTFCPIQTKFGGWAERGFARSPGPGESRWMDAPRRPVQESGNRVFLFMENLEIEIYYF